MAYDAARRSVGFPRPIVKCPRHAIVGYAAPELDLFELPPAALWEIRSVNLRILLTSAWILLSSTALAQQVDDRARGAARALAEDGVSALQSGDVNAAVDKLERAYQIVRLPAVGLWSARALAKAGRLVSAAERYNEVTRWSGAPDPKQDQAKADAAKERDELLPRVPSVTLTIEGGSANDVKVTLDGEPVLAALIGTAQPVDPKRLVHLGVDDAAFVKHVARILKPGGFAMIYNLHPPQNPADKPYIPWADGRCPFARELWEGAGLRVLAFDVDDSPAVRTMARALGWDKGEQPLDPEKDLFATYTLVTRITAP